MMTTRGFFLSWGLLAATLAAHAQPNCAAGIELVCVAASESTAAGSIVAGSFQNTRLEDGSYEVLDEQDATVGPPPKRADLLQHVWEVPVPSANGYIVQVSAYRDDAGGDGDDFRFAASLDGGLSWTTLFDVDRSGSAGAWEQAIVGSAQGAVYIRAVDTDRTQAHKNHARLWIDYLAVVPSDAPPEPPPDDSVSAKRIVGYYTSWGIYAREYYVSQIPAGKLTHINYAFANVEPDGTVILGDEFADVNKSFGNEPPDALFKGNFQQLQILKGEHPHLKTLISVGGWTWSDHFSDIFADKTKRETFCSSLLGFVTQYGFDGADIDWEYPGDPGEGDNSYRPGQDGANFVAGLQRCSELFRPSGKLLTVATPCSDELYADQMDLEGMADSLDWVNLLSYDFAGPWSSVTHHNSPLFVNPADPDEPEGFSQNRCVVGHLGELAPEKITLGVPFYGRAFAGVDGHFGGGVLGLFQSYQGVPKGTWDGGKWGVTGVFDYEDLLLNILPSGVLGWDTQAMSPTFTWNLGRKNGLGFMTYEDRASICLKASYVNGWDPRVNASSPTLPQLGGMMAWELSGDAEAHPESLLNAMYCGLNPAYEGCANVCSE